VNDKMERILKEAVLASFKELLRHLLAGTEKNEENLT
jgi:hypothetical protein